MGTLSAHFLPNRCLERFGSRRVGSPEHVHYGCARGKQCAASDRCGQFNEPGPPTFRDWKPPGPRDKNKKMANPTQRNCRTKKYVIVSARLLRTVAGSWQYLSSDVCPEDNEEDDQNGFVLYCVWQLCTQWYTHSLTNIFTVDCWFKFPLDLGLFFVLILPFCLLLLCYSFSF